MQDYINAYLSTSLQIANLKQQKAEIEREVRRLQAVQNSLVHDYLEPYFLNELKADKNTLVQTNQGQVQFKTNRSTVLVVHNEPALISELITMKREDLLTVMTKRTPNKAAIKKDKELVSSLENAKLQINLNLSLHFKART